MDDAVTFTTLKEDEDKAEGKDQAESSSTRQRWAGTATARAVQSGAASGSAVL
jgi:hypothetical protein